MSDQMVEPNPEEQEPDEFVLGKRDVSAILYAVEIEDRDKLIELMEPLHAADIADLIAFIQAFRAGAPAAFLGADLDAMAQIAKALGASNGDAAGAIFALNRELGIPESLAALGFDEAGIEKAADEVLEKEYPNPKPVEREGVVALLRDAVAGNPPGKYGEPE
jgi:hypothetical protein